MYINELSPNPVGKDTEGEYIKIYNDSDALISLSGWSIKDVSGKTFVVLQKSVPARGFLVLDYQTTKISLNNSGDTIYLYDQNKNLVDKLEYSQNISDDVVVKKDITTGKVSLSSESIKKEIIEVVEARPNTNSIGVGEPLTTQVINGDGIDNLVFIGIGVSLALAIAFWLAFKKVVDS
jgi:hypothetical protein